MKKKGRSFVTLTRWKKRFPLCGNQPSLGSWIFQEKAGCGFGCKACHLQGVKSEFGEATLRSDMQLRPARFIKHEDSLSHKRAVAALTRCKHCIELATSSEDDKSAPPTKQFLEVLLSRAQGVAMKNLRDVGHTGKIAQIQHCIAEALRATDREHIKHSTSLVFHADGRKHRFTVRSSAGSLVKLKVRRGILGHTDFIKIKANQPDAASAYCEAMQKIM